MEYPVKVNQSRYITEGIERKLRRFGFQKAGDEYFAVLTDHRFNQFVPFAKKHHVKYFVVSSFASRSGGYRKQFFAKVRPFVGDYYFCAYCGRLIHKKDVTVDHLYPVGKVKKSPSLQRRMRRRGIISVNDVRNLVASCEKCNAHKAAKTGLWVIRGKLGRHPYLWVFRHGIRIGLIIFGGQYLFLHRAEILPLVNAIADYIPRVYDVLKTCFSVISQFALSVIRSL